MLSVLQQYARYVLYKCQHINTENAACTGNGGFVLWLGSRWRFHLSPVLAGESSE